MASSGPPTVFLDSVDPIRCVGASVVGALTGHGVLRCSSLLLQPCRRHLPARYDVFLRVLSGQRGRPNMIIGFAAQFGVLFSCHHAIGSRAAALCSCDPARPTDAPPPASLVSACAQHALAAALACALWLGVAVTAQLLCQRFSLWPTPLHWRHWRDRLRHHTAFFPHSVLLLSLAPALPPLQRPLARRVPSRRTTTNPAVAAQPGAPPAEASGRWTPATWLSGAPASAWAAGLVRVDSLAVFQAATTAYAVSLLSLALGRRVTLYGWHALSPPVGLLVAAASLTRWAGCVAGSLLALKMSHGRL